jgi:hypothetical protein
MVRVLYSKKANKARVKANKVRVKAQKARVKVQKARVKANKNSSEASTGGLAGKNHSKMLIFGFLV